MLGAAALAVFQISASPAAEPARILTNHVGYEPAGPKQAVIQGGAGDRFAQCAVRAYPGGAVVFQGKAAPGIRVADWRDWRFWTFDFGALQKEGRYTVECGDGRPDSEGVVRSFPFAVRQNALERATLSSVLAYFKAERASGDMDQADRHLAFEGSPRPPIDARGGWYDATGDYGIHLSHLDFSTYFNPQQVPLVVYSLGRSFELLEARHDPNFAQIERRLIDEMSYGADFLVRMHRPGHSFYESIQAPGPGKKAQDRRIAHTMTGFGIKDSAKDQQAFRHDGIYESGYRSGGGFAIAGLAIAARLGAGGDFDRKTYLQHAEDAFAYLQAHNRELLNDGVENIVDDYGALVAATELLRATGKPVYAAAAGQRAQNLMERLASDGAYRDYWRADGKDRPFFHPSDAGAPVVSLLRYHALADTPMQARIREAVRRSLQFELGITREVANPFGLARQYVQSRSRGRYGAFFFPHDTETAPWWQGENARLASLAAAARLAVPLFGDDPAFQRRLQAYAADQLNWILGLNPFDASMLQGTGRNNPEYGFFGSWQYTQTPGGIVNGVTSGLEDDRGIDFNLPYAQTGKDVDWRWGEQWLPHSAWYLLAVAARPTSGAEAGRK
ncbi:glycoside hydrolase [Frateuria sp. Soil773]|uniref:glycoside hydrolase family 9 protein n=1 Tax=Frateuria sp. Soil773 TaxID=1736407 RepID=UPI0006FE30AD|nr:glycoside hydrolase family 9 protein [Frateuria sp. Soil773]KRF01873.1 glycoside hydrolase [Frateuria sp. Soil773]